MKTKYWYGVISMASVIVMFIWSFIEKSWAHCWLAVLFGPLLISVLNALESEKKNWSRWSPAIGIASVIIMFIWSFISGWSYCWISPMIGGLLTAVLGVLNKTKGNAR